MEKAGKKGDGSTAEGVGGADNGWFLLPFSFSLPIQRFLTGFSNQDLGNSDCILIWLFYKVRINQWVITLLVQINRRSAE